MGVKGKRSGSGREQSVWRWVLQTRGVLGVFGAVAYGLSVGSMTPRTPVEHLIWWALVGLGVLLFGVWLVLTVQDLVAGRKQRAFYATFLAMRAQRHTVTPIDEHDDGHDDEHALIYRVDGRTR